MLDGPVRYTLVALVPIAFACGGRTVETAPSQPEVEAGSEQQPGGPCGRCDAGWSCPDYPIATQGTFATCVADCRAELSSADGACTSPGAVCFACAEEKGELFYCNYAYGMWELEDVSFSCSP
jgi:hypothetical protein